MDVPRRCGPWRSEDARRNPRDRLSRRLEDQPIPTGPKGPEAARGRDKNAATVANSFMPYLSLQGPQPKIGQPFSAMLDDTGSRTSLPVTAELVSEWWIKIGGNDWRQVLSCHSV